MFLHAEILGFVESFSSSTENRQRTDNLIGQLKHSMASTTSKHKTQTSKRQCCMTSIRHLSKFKGSHAHHCNTSSNLLIDEDCLFIDYKWLKSTQHDSNRIKLCWWSDRWWQPSNISGVRFPSNPLKTASPRWQIFLDLPLYNANHNLRRYTSRKMKTPTSESPIPRFNDIFQQHGS